MIPLFLLLAAGQAAPQTTDPKAQHWSILLPEEQCTPHKNEAGEDIVVCAPAPPREPIPYPDEAYGPRPSNPFRTGTGALLAENAPCGATLRGCTVGFGPPIVPIVKGLAEVAARTFARKPDKTGRVAISLDETAPPPPSRIEP